MNNKKKILWIEDGALHDLEEMAATIFVDGRFDLEIAGDVAEGIALLKKYRYHVVIVDLRLPPGNDREWIKIFMNSGSSKSSAKLGLKLLYTILGHPKAMAPLKDRPDWISPNVIGILSVERNEDIAENLNELGIKHFTRKVASLPDTALLDLVQDVINSLDKRG